MVGMVIHSLNRRLFPIAATKSEDETVYGSWLGIAIREPGGIRMGKPEQIIDSGFEALCAGIDPAGGWFMLNVPIQ